jgi:hypothetical protein
VTPPTLIFRPFQLRREIAALGAWTIATIIPGPGPRQQATWLLNLPDWPHKQGPASSFEAARRKIEHEVREWFCFAGLDDIAAKLEVRIETRDEQERARA